MVIAPVIPTKPDGVFSTFDFCCGVKVIIIRSPVGKTRNEKSGVLKTKILIESYGVNTFGWPFALNTP